MTGRDVAAQFDDDSSLGGVEDEGVLWIKPGREWLGGGRGGTHDGEQYGKNTGHVISRR
jgi:hypothetical protein